MQLSMGRLRALQESPAQTSYTFVFLVPETMASVMSSVRVQRSSFSASVRSKAAVKVQARAPMVVRAAAIAAEDVPSPEKRDIMNLLLLGAVGLPVSDLSCSHSPPVSLSKR